MLNMMHSRCGQRHSRISHQSLNSTVRMISFSFWTKFISPSECVSKSRYANYDLNFIWQNCSFCFNSERICMRERLAAIRTHRIRFSFAIFVINARKKQVTSTDELSLWCLMWLELHLISKRRARMQIIFFFLLSLCLRIFNMLESCSLARYCHNNRL